MAPRFASCLLYTKRENFLEGGGGEPLSIENETAEKELDPRKGQIPKFLLIDWRVSSIETHKSCSFDSIFLFLLRHLDAKKRASDPIGHPINFRVDNNFCPG